MLKDYLFILRPVEIGVATVSRANASEFPGIEKDKELKTIHALQGNWHSN